MWSEKSPSAGPCHSVGVMQFEEEALTVLSIHAIFLPDVFIFEGILTDVYGELVFQRSPKTERRFRNQMSQSVN